MHHCTAKSSARTMPSCNGAPAEAWQHTVPLDGLLIWDYSESHAGAFGASSTCSFTGWCHGWYCMQRYFGRALAHHRHTCCLDTTQGSVGGTALAFGCGACHMCWLLKHRKPPHNASIWALLFEHKLLEGVGILFAQKYVQGYGWQGDENLPQVPADEELPIAPRCNYMSWRKTWSTCFREFNVLAMPDAERSHLLEAREYVLYHYRAFYSGVDATTLQRFIKHIWPYDG